MPNQCSDPECDRNDIVGRGLCSLHYQRYRLRGVLDEVVPPTARPCAICGGPTNDRRWNSMYCSKRCNDRARYERSRRKPRRQTNCDQCGTDLAGKRTDARFCSPECSQIWRNARIAEKLLESKQDRVCRGCGGPVPPSRKGNAQYCSDECKIRSRRHEAYGLTLAELRLLLEQHEVCAICGTRDWGKKGPQVDHNHETGKVRGILCSNCNNGLGRFQDDPARLRAAADYLEKAIAYLG